MNFRLNKTALAVAQAVACITMAACGGGNNSTSSTRDDSPQGDDGRSAVRAAAVTSANLHFDLLSATGGTALPFTVGQALPQGQVPAGSALVADIPNFQFVAKNRWPDGSAKFAILSGRADLTANTWKTIGLSVGSPPAAAAISTADLAATGVTASVQFGSFGTA